MNVIQRPAPRIGGALLLGVLLASSGHASQGGEAHGQGAQKKRPVELVLPLEKVEAANAQALEKSLESLTRTAYSCPACLFTQLHEGACPDCGEDLERSEKAFHPVRRVDVDPADRTMRVFLTPDQTLRLSEVERALAKNRAELRREDVPILPWSRLILDVTEEGQTPEELRDAFTTLPFEIAAFHVDDEDDEDAARAVVLLGSDRSDGGTTLGALSHALNAAQAPFTVADLVWSGPCKVCSEHGAAVAACRKCCVDRGTDSM